MDEEEHVLELRSLLVAQKRGIEIINNAVVHARLRQKHEAREQEVRGGLRVTQRLADNLAALGARDGGPQERRPQIERLEVGRDEAPVIGHHHQTHGQQGLFTAEEHGQGLLARVAQRETRCPCTDGADQT